MTRDDALNLTALITKLRQDLLLKDTSSLLPLAKEDLSLLFTGKEILCHGLPSFFFAPVYLYDKKEDCYYPLFFLRSHYRVYKEVTYLSRENDFPQFNQVALDLLHTFEIQTGFTFRSDDLESFLFSLQASLDASEEAKERLALIDLLGFYPEDIVSKSRIYQMIKPYLNDQKLSLKFQGLVGALKNTTTPLATSNQYSGGYFLPYQEAILKNSKGESIKVRFEDTKIEFDFMLQVLSSFILGEENLVFVTDNDEHKQTANWFLKEYHLEDYSYEFSLFDPFTYKAEKVKETEEKRDIVESLSRLREEEKEYVTYIRKKQNVYAYPKLESPLKELLYEACLENKKAYFLDASDYSKEDGQRDINFLMTFEDYPSVINTSINRHPFFGLSVSPKKENYEALEDAITQSLEKLEEFLHVLKEEKVRNINGDILYSLHEFVELGKDFDVLNDYNGFPKRYFRMEENEDPNLKIQQLKELYQSLSSSQLLVDNLYYESVYSLDVMALIEMYKTGGFFKRRKAKKTLTQCLKVKKNPDMETLIRILTSYYQAKKALEEKLPVYLEVYGDSVSTMNGVVEIESNTKYLKRFRDRGKINPDFNIENPFIKKALRDKDFRIRIYQSYQKAKAVFLELKKCLNRFIGYFLDDPRDYLNLSFEDLSSLLKAKASGTYEEFFQYASFLEQLEITSMPLQLMMRRYQEKDLSLTSFRKDFLYSLYKAFYQQSKETFYEEEMKSETIYERYLNDISEIRRLSTNALVSALKNLQDTQVKKASYLDDCQRLAYSIREKNYSYPEIEKGYALKTQIHPIVLAKPYDFYDVEDDFFDNVLLCETTLLNDEELLAGMRVGKKVIFLNSMTTPDKRLDGYPEIVLSYENLYLKNFIPDGLPKCFLDALASQADKLGYELILDNPLFPLCLRKKGEENCTFALACEAILKEEISLASLSSLREFLYRNYNIKLIYFFIYEALFENEGYLERLLTKLSR